MDWLTILLLWIAVGLIIAVAVLHTRLSRTEDHLLHLEDHLLHVDAISEMAFTALKEHLDGKHVELHLLHLTEDGTPIRETEEE